MGAPQREVVPVQKVELVPTPVTRPMSVAEPLGIRGPQGPPGEPGPEGESNYDDLPDLTLIFENGLI